MFMDEYEFEEKWQLVIKFLQSFLVKSRLLSFYYLILLFIFKSPSEAIPK